MSSSSSSPPPSRPGLSARTGLGSNPFPPSSPSSISSTDRSGLPSTFGGSKSRKRRRSPSPPPNSHPESHLEPGAWEKHTRGIGSKILAKHGFRGRLGAQETGIAAPLQPVVRPRGVGLGAVHAGREKADGERVSEQLRERERVTRLPATLEGKRWRKEGGGEGGVRDHLRTREREHERVREEVLDDLIRARGEGKWGEVEVVGVVRIMAEEAQAEVHRVNRRMGTEKLIAETAAREMHKVQDEVAQAGKIIDCLGELEGLLESLKRANIEQDEFVESLQKTAPCLERAVKMGALNGDGVRKGIGGLVEDNVRMKMEEILLGDGRGRQKRVEGARRVVQVLKAARELLSEEEYVQVCTGGVFGVGRRVVGRAGWDAVRDGWVGDMMGEVVHAGDRVMGEVMGVFAEEILLGRLVERVEVEMTREVGEGLGRVHIWVHPWLVVVGRKSLSEVLGRVRVGIMRELEKWQVGDRERREKLVELVGKWKGVMSRRKMQMGLVRHVLGKIKGELRRVCSGGEVLSDGRVPVVFEDLDRWSAVVSTRMMVAEVGDEMFEGLASRLRNVVFGGEDWENGWRRGCKMYMRWKGWMPESLKDSMQGGLAGLLFILHAGRVVQDGVQRERLRYEGVAGLMKNMFTVDLRHNKVTRREDSRQGERKRDLSGLKEVVEEVARREGLSVVGGERGEDGMGIVWVGGLKVVIDGRRGVLLIVDRNGEQRRAVGMEEMIRLAKRSE